MISRNWHCLNERCGKAFHSFEHGNPPCPKCGCVRVSWVPGGGHIMGMAPRVDARLRSIADQHGMTNLNSPSPSRLNRAAPKAPIYRQVEGYTHHWGFGVSSPISTQGAICVSAPANVAGKIVVGDAAGARLPSNPETWMPGPAANAKVYGRHRAKP